jgi:hypothetical protein
MQGQVGISGTLHRTIVSFVAGPDGHGRSGLNRAPARKECDEPDHKKNKKEDLGDPGSRPRDSGESKNRCDEGDHQEDERPVKHT